MELTADLFNVLNLLDRDWGVWRTIATQQGDAEILWLVGYDEVHERGIYSFVPVDRNVRDDGATRWSMQLGARYNF